MKNKRKILMAFMSAMVMAVLFTACGGNAADEAETTPQAPITTPQTTPQTTPEPTPEPTPPPHVHTWQEANFQQARICLECGDEEGRPLPAGFAQSGLTLSGLGVAHSYVTATSGVGRTVGNLTVELIDIIEGNERLEAEEGYEWRIVRATKTFGDNNAWQHGARWHSRMGCYFDFDLLEAREHEGYGTGWTINFYGEEREILFDSEAVQSEWIGQTFHRITDFMVRVPIGYDGLLLYYFNAANWDGIETGDYITIADITDEDTLWFRLN
ncbi:MAG: hypothetical protein LBE35_07675 [Clostridiales bacterium]|jgi:hypothetical protein|nr:hypothetical protein [Clostridiales bacterium]